MGNTYDVVVAGAGHNGLIAGAYLSKAGLSTCVVELRDYVGGGVSTRELTIPGFKHDVCSIAHMGMQRSPIVQADELELLSKYGLEYIVPDESIAILYPDDSYLAIHRDLDITCERIAKFSEKDAESYRKFVTWGIEVLAFMGEGMSKPPAPWGLAQSMMDSSPEGQELLRLFNQSYIDVCKEWFESPQLVMGINRMLTEGMVHADHGVGVGMLIYLALSHKYGYSLPKGGSGELSEALVRCIEANGGEVRVSCPIDSFKLSGNECTGVVLEGGEEILAKKAVVSSLNVMQIPDMVPEGVLPEDYVRKSKRLKLSDFMAFHMELALNEAPKYKNDMTLRERWFVEFVDDWDLPDYMRVYDDLVYGERPIKAPLIMCPTALDQGTRCPEGKHTLYVYLFAAHDLKEGAEHWDNIKEETEDKLLALLNERTTNMTSDNILGKWSMSPLDYARYNPSWPKGDFAHFQSNIIQQGANRPFPGWSNYKTPIDKLFLVGCSTHPGWAVSGAARTGMYTVFEELGMDFEDMMVK